MRTVIITFMLCWCAAAQFNQVPPGPLYIAGNATIGTTVLTTGQSIGVLCSGDVTTTLQAAINALAAASGGIVRLSSGACYSTAQITIPNDAASPAPHQVPITLEGQGSHWAGISSPIKGETSLDLRYSGTVGKIVSYGLGLLATRDITLTNATSTDSLPFVYVTNTTFQPKRTSFLGSASASPYAQAIVLGGQGATVTGDSTGYFQGYGTLIDGNYFYQVQGVLLQVNANAVQITNNVWWNTCKGAAISDWNDASYQNAGLYTSGNLIEMNNMTYGIALYRTLGAVLNGDMFYDASGTFTSYYFFNGANALPNLVTPGFIAVASIAKLCTGAGCPTFPTASAAGVLSNFDKVGGYVNSNFKTGRLEVIGNRIVLRSANSDEVFDFYNPSAHLVRLQPTQSDGSLEFTDYQSNTLLTQANDGTWKLRNNKASTGYTYWETQGGAGQSTIPLGRYKSAANVTGTTIEADGAYTFNLQGAGSGNRPVCFDLNGKLYAGTNAAGVLACP
jgi:hypothetical protein